MLDTLVLHIRTRHDERPRVLPVVGSTLRIGRSPKCEVILDDPEIRDVECLLRRRGPIWTLQPVASEERSSTHGPPRSVQLGTTFRVGGHWLTLERLESRIVGLGSYERPIVVEPSVPEAPAAPRVETRQASGSDALERLGRWQARLKERERWLKRRREERRWEARWRAAGAALRLREATDGEESQALKESPASGEPDASIPVESPNEARRETEFGIEPALASRECDSPSAETVEFSDPTREAYPPAPETECDPLEGLDSALREFASGDRSDVVISSEASGENPPTERTQPTWPPFDEREAVSAGHLGAELTPATDSVEELPLGSAGLDVGLPAGDTDAAAVESCDQITKRENDSAAEQAGVAERSFEPANVQGPDHPAETVAVSPFFDASTHADAPQAWSGPFVAHTGLWIGATDPIHSEAHSLQTPAPEPAPERLPSVRDILGSVPRAPRPQHEPASARRRSSRPQPTPSREPATIAIRAKWLIPPLAAAVLAVSGFGLRLAWIWGQDDFAAGRIADALAAKSKGDKPIEVPQAPAAAWWSSTPEHLHLRAMAHAIGRDGNKEEVPFLLHTARSASRVDPAVRLAGAESDSTAPAAGSVRPVSSRDVVSLHRSGKKHIAAKQYEAAAGAYREALAIAARTELGRAAIQTFLDDPELKRFALPLETELRPMIEDLRREMPGGFSSWSEVLPASPIARLVAFRMLKDDSPRDAEPLFAKLAEQPADDEPAVRRALALAAYAEALALRGDYPASAAQYEKAVAAIPDDVLKRTWLVNLAEIAMRVGNTDVARRAWDEARGPSPDDAINTQIVRARSRHGIGAKSPSPKDPAEPRPFPNPRR